MAGDWIKIETNLAEKPEVLALASRFFMNRWEVAGRLFRLWAWFDAHSVDGHAHGVTKTTLDDAVGWDGMSDGLISVGWLIETKTGVYIPKFDRHNGSPSKSRAQATRRKQASRSALQDCHAPSVTKTGPEKRREEYERASLSQGAPSAPASPSIVPEDDGLPITNTTREELAKLELKVRALRPAWKLTLGAHEQRALFDSMSTLSDLEDEDWQTLKDYLHARLPQGAPGWQPTSRKKFLETVGDVWGHAFEWKRKQKPTAKVLPDRPAPAPQTPEDKQALAAFLSNRPSKAAN